MKTYENVQKLKFLNEFLEGHNGFIAGGCFKDIFEDKKPKDIDIFFRNSSDYYEAVTLFRKNEKYDFVCKTCNAITYLHKNTNLIIQLIHTVYGEPRNVINHFDFTVCKYAYYKNENNYISICHDSFDLHVNKKILIADTILYPISTFKRALRYSSYGYNLEYETLKSLIYIISDEDISDISREFYEEEVN